MNTGSNLLEKAVKRETKKIFKMRLNTPVESKYSPIDLLNIKKSQYTHIPYYKEDRLKKYIMNCKNKLIKFIYKSILYLFDLFFHYEL